MISPNIFICGPSGSGKSTSLENLDPARTGILNTEQKALPFRNAAKFKTSVPVPTYVKFREYFEYMLKNPNLDVIVIESFTALTEMIYRDFSKAYDGFDLWAQYNKEIDWVLNRSKNSPNKIIVFLGIDEFIDDNNSVGGRYVKVQGKQWRKSVEKEFVVVCFTHVHMEDNEPQYSFVTQTDGKTSAKSPKGMLPRSLPNDLAEVIRLAKEYYKPTEA